VSLKCVIMSFTPFVAVSRELPYFVPDSKYLRSSIPDQNKTSSKYMLAFAVTYDIRYRSKFACTIIVFDMLSTLQEHIFSAIAQSLYSKCSSIRHRKINGTIEVIFT